MGEQTNISKITVVEKYGDLLYLQNSPTRRKSQTKPNLLKMIRFFIREE